MADADEKWPSELRVTGQGRVLRVSFEGAETFELAAEYLRVMSPSAEVQGHSRKERKTVAGKRDVAIVALEPVGTYAVRIVFEDTHATGIYTWPYLHELGVTHEAKWQAYLDELAEKGLSREGAGSGHRPHSH